MDLVAAKSSSVNQKRLPIEPMMRMSASTLNKLMNTLEVNFLKLAECLVSPGWRLAIAAGGAPAIHYNLSGEGRLIVGDDAPIPLTPHMLAIIPADKPFKLEVDLRGKSSLLRTVESQLYNFGPGELRKIRAGEDDPELILICGYFRASYGASIDLFSNLPSPIVERFDPSDEVDQKLKSAMAELVAQEVGSNAMSTALLKQVLVTILRRSLSSSDLWAERFSILGDPQIARAFSDMAARPGSPHSVQTLSHASGLSRSAFMSRFAEAFGKSPISVLRELRMHHAARLLAADNRSIDQIANAVGYASRSSFCRAFRKVHGCDPSEYRCTEE